MRGREIPVPQALEKLDHIPLGIALSIRVDDSQLIESPDVGRQLRKVAHGPLQSRGVDDRLLELKIVANGLGLAIELCELDGILSEFLQPPEVGRGQAARLREQMIQRNFSRRHPDVVDFDDAVGVHRADGCSLELYGRGGSDPVGARRGRGRALKIPQALKGGRADSAILQEYLPRFTTRDYRRTGRIDNMVKDLR